MELEIIIHNAVQSALSDFLATLGGIDVAAHLEAAARLEVIRKKALLSPAEVAALYGFPVATLATWRSRGLGPDYTKAEGSIFYTHKQLQCWIDSCSVRLNRK